MAVKDALIHPHHSLVSRSPERGGQIERERAIKAKMEDGRDDINWKPDGEETRTQRDGGTNNVNIGTTNPRARKRTKEETGMGNELISIRFSSARQMMKDYVVKLPGFQPSNLKQLELPGVERKRVCRRAVAPFAERQ